MYTVAVSKDFIANHYLIGGDWGHENFPHAHQYVLELAIETPALDKHGYCVDIVAIEAALNDVVTYFRDSMLNDKPEFAGVMRQSALLAAGGVHQFQQTVDDGIFCAARLQA